MEAVQIDNIAIFNAAKLEARTEKRKLYMMEYSKKNYETKLKSVKVTCATCSKDYVITNKWKHENTKFHIFFKELLEARAREKPKEEELEKI
jgi:hypothetical protein